MINLHSLSLLHQDVKLMIMSKSSVMYILYCVDNPPSPCANFVTHVAARMHKRLEKRTISMASDNAKDLFGQSSNLETIVHFYGERLALHLRGRTVGVTNFGMSELELAHKVMVVTMRVYGKDVYGSQRTRGPWHTFREKFS